MGRSHGERHDDDGYGRPDIEAAVAAAEVHPLLCAVAQRTGDLSLLRDDFAPDQAQLLTPGRGLGPEQEDEARAPGRRRAGSRTTNLARPSTR